MVRSELIEQLATDYPDLDTRSLNAMVDTFFAEIIGHLAKGGQVEVRGFGVFSVRVRNRQTARNPRTGEKLDKAERPGPFFRASKLLAARIRNHD